MCEWNNVTVRQSRWWAGGGDSEPHWVVESCCSGWVEFVVKLHGRCHTVIPAITPRCYTVQITATPAGLLPTHSILSAPMLTEFAVCFCVFVLLCPLDPEDEGTTFLQNIRGYCVMTQHHISEDLIVLTNTTLLWDPQILQSSCSLS